ncbi:T9SS type A sorting domain-containing protein [candidate division KSB1 bacterium]|nr:T9SS type A sorting domain-containing protein [candidate division KSB1 bacterium]
MKANVEFILSNLFGEKLTNVDEFASALPEKFELFQNHPNPFNPQTEITFTVPTKSPITLEIYDLLGRKVATLIDQELLAGQHQIKWDATNFAAGIYFYQLQSGDFIQGRKMILLK